MDIASARELAAHSRRATTLGASSSTQKLAWQSICLKLSLKAATAYFKVSCGATRPPVIDPSEEVAIGEWAVLHRLEGVIGVFAELGSVCGRPPGVK